MLRAKNFNQVGWGLGALPLVEPIGVQLLDFYYSSVSVLVLLLNTHPVSSQYS